MLRRRLLRVSLTVVLLAFVASPKEQPAQVIVWPESGTPLLRFTFGKFKEIGSFRNERTYVTDTTVENLGKKTIPNANFSLYLLDKSKIRIGEG